MNTAMNRDPSAFAVLLGGPLTVTDRLLAQLDGARVIAADGGMTHARTLGLTPELWVGDFDSTPPALLAQWPDIPRQSHPAVKNETDGEIATDAAIRRGASRIIMAGALGGERSDHVIFHLIHAFHLGAQGLDVLVTSGLEEAMPLKPGANRFDLPAGSLFSILAFSSLSELAITGARYPLEGVDLRFGTSRTVSNVAEGEVTVSLSHGTAFVLARPYDMSGT